MQTYDAGFEREWLTAEWDHWIAAGFISPHRAERFYRRLRRLAKVIGQTADSTMRYIRADASCMEVHS